MKAEDPDAVALEVRMLEEKRQLALSRSKRPTTAPSEGRSSSRPSTAPAPCSSSLDSIRRSTVAPVTLVPIDLNTRGDQQLRLSAKREAYDIIKRTGSHSPRGNVISSPYRGAAGGGGGRRGTFGSALCSEEGEGDSLVYSPSVTSSRLFNSSDHRSITSHLGGSSMSSSLANSRRSSTNYGYVEPFLPLHTMENYHHN